MTLIVMVRAFVLVFLLEAKLLYDMYAYIVSFTVTIIQLICTIYTIMVVSNIVVEFFFY